MSEGEVTLTDDMKKRRGRRADQGLKSEIIDMKCVSINENVRSDCGGPTVVGLQCVQGVTCTVQCVQGVTCTVQCVQGVTCTVQCVRSYFTARHQWLLPGRDLSVSIKPALKEPDLKEPYLKEPALKEPDLKDTDLKEPDLKEPDLKEPDLKELDLKDTHLKEPYLRTRT
ncbi:hypothetical protein F2P81_013369 [Scophthalmus maximus]|uniref:Uncharacterized protein n=1 Tax=Scophthalmus maximus TaxID=52904 RepID=A0A6A4SX67_SCOMX|nr:hypothetical protein F2P81_013369 [Scophthalmus maximus]